MSAVLDSRQPTVIRKENMKKALLIGKTGDITVREVDGEKYALYIPVLTPVERSLSQDWVAPLSRRFVYMACVGPYMVYEESLPR